MSDGLPTRTSAYWCPPLQHRELYASLLPAVGGDWQGLAASLERAGVDGIHLDVIDGVYAEGQGFDIQDVVWLTDHTTLPVEVHLMCVGGPLFAPIYLAAGSRRVFVHSLEPADIDGERIHPALRLDDPGRTIGGYFPEVLVLSFIPDGQVSSCSRVRRTRFGL